MNLDEILNNNSEVDNQDEKHYFAQILPIEDLDPYYNEDMAVEDNLWAGGNDYYPEVNESFRETVVDLLQDIKEEVAKTTYNHNIPSKGTSMALLGVVTNLVQTYYPSSILSRQDINFLINMSDKFATASAKSDNILEENGIICRVLGTLLGEEFKYGWFDTGDDWDASLYLYYICPADISDERLNYIGAVLQGIGVEVKLANIKCSKEDFLEDNVDTTRDYLCGLKDDDDIMQWVANKYGCSPDEVYLLDETDDYLDEEYKGALCCEFWL